MRQDYFFVPAPTGEENDNAHPLSVNCGGYCELEPNAFTDLPHGRRDYTLFYLHAGKMTVAFGNRKAETVEAGTVILIPPNLKIRHKNPCEAPASVYWAHFTGYDVTLLLHSIGIPESGAVLPIPASPTATSSFQRFLDEMKGSPDEATKLRAAAALVMLLTTLVRLSEDVGRQIRRLSYSFAYMQEHFTEDIDVEELAATEGLGTSQFHVLFRSLAGMTPTQYITKLRMSLAARLLCDAALSIGEVAERCGYGDSFYFSRVFHRETGKSPSSYRKGERT